jgi:hypothetical protein
MSLSAPDMPAAEQVALKVAVTNGPGGGVVVQQYVCFGSTDCCAINIQPSTPGNHVGAAVCEGMKMGFIVWE